MPNEVVPLIAGLCSELPNHDRAWIFLIESRDLSGTFVNAFVFDKECSNRTMR